MWHHHHGNYKDVLFARQLLYSLEISGKKVFPGFDTCWHFDDKVGQKYLLESIGAPFVPTYIFYTRQEALDWVQKTSFPKVFKLRGGAGSANVRLVGTRGAARKLIDRAFGKGFSPFNGWRALGERIRKYRSGQGSLAGTCKGVARLFFPTEYARMHGREKGYVYFQDFIANNSFDARVVVIGDKAFGFKRMVRTNDFRASGSGNIVYDKKEQDERCVAIAFAVNEKLKSQCIAYDFVFDEKNTPLIIEISYGYIVHLYDQCEGYWDKNLNWHAGTRFDFCGWMVENLIAKQESRLE
jgi:glutathione synthase/RimK-type ligase-like ATP-grasp enzyme